MHGYAAADFGRLAARATGARLVLHEHFADPRMPAYQALADRLLRRLTDRAIAVSGSTRDFLVRRALRARGARPPHLERRAARRVRPRARASGRSRVAARRSGFPDDAARGRDRSAGSTSRRATATCSRRRRACSRASRGPALLIVGDGDLMAPLRQQAAGLGIADRVGLRRAPHRRARPARAPSTSSASRRSTRARRSRSSRRWPRARRSSRRPSTAAARCWRTARRACSCRRRDAARPGRAPSTASLGDAALRDALGARAREASRRYDVARLRRRRCRRSTTRCSRGRR